MAELVIEQVPELVGVIEPMPKLVTEWVTEMITRLVIELMTKV